MAGTIVNNMTAINNAENATDWTGGAPAAYSGFQREGTNCIGEQASQGSYNAYDTIASRNMANETIHGWMLAWGNPDTAANVGFGLVIGDGTNRAAFQVGGSDLGGFAPTPGGWQCFIVSVPDKDDASAINLAGTTANINDGAITQLGYYFDLTNKALGNIDNVFWDVLWAYNHTGYALELTGGTSGAPAVLSDIAVWDASSLANRATGAFFELASSVFSQQAPIQIGDDGTGSSYFTATNEEIIFSDINNINNHKFAVVGNATGTNVALFNSFTFRNAHSTLTPTLNFNGGNIDTLEFDGCSFLGIDANFSNNADATGHSVVNSTFDGCAQIDPGDVTFTNVVFANTLDANGAILLDADGTANWSDLTFISDGTGHAIYITAPGTYDFTNLSYTGYGADDTTDAVVYNDSGGAVTINVNGGDTPTVRNGTGASTTVVATVPVKITAQEADGTPIAGAAVFLETTPGGTDIIPPGNKTDVNGEVSTTYGGATPQDVVGYVAKGTSSPVYKRFTISATIEASGLDFVAVMTPDE